MLPSIIGDDSVLFRGVISEYENTIQKLIGQWYLFVCSYELRHA